MLRETFGTAGPGAAARTHFPVVTDSTKEMIAAKDMLRNRALDYLEKKPRAEGRLCKGCKTGLTPRTCTYVHLLAETIVRGERVLLSDLEDTAGKRDGAEQYLQRDWCSRMTCLLGPTCPYLHRRAGVRSAFGQASLPSPAAPTPAIALPWRPARAAASLSSPTSESARSPPLGDNIICGKVGNAVFRFPAHRYVDNLGFENGELRCVADCSICNEMGHHDPMQCKFLHFATVLLRDGSLRLTHDLAWNLAWAAFLQDPNTRPIMCPEGAQCGAPLLCEQLHTKSDVLARDRELVTPPIENTDENIREVGLVIEGTKHVEGLLRKAIERHKGTNAQRSAPVSELLPTWKKVLETVPAARENFWYVDYLYTRIEVISGTRNAAVHKMRVKSLRRFHTTFTELVPELRQFDQRVRSVRTVNKRIVALADLQEGRGKDRAIEFKPCTWCVIEGCDGSTCTYLHPRTDVGLDTASDHPLSFRNPEVHETQVSETHGDARPLVFQNAEEESSETSDPDAPESDAELSLYASPLTLDAADAAVIQNEAKCLATGTFALCSLKVEKRLRTFVSGAKGTAFGNLVECAKRSFHRHINTVPLLTPRLRLLVGVRNNALHAQPCADAYECPLPMVRLLVQECHDDLGRINC